MLNTIVAFLAVTCYSLELKPLEQSIGELEQTIIDMSKTAKDNWFYLDNRMIIAAGKQAN
jgi:hypothetical protein